MKTLIPIGVTARNEAKNILYFMRSLQTAVSFAETHLPCGFSIHVILNDNEDETETLLREYENVVIFQTKGGLIEAQRTLASKFRGRAPFIIFSDADIEMEKDAIFQIANQLLLSPETQVAYCDKFPVKPMRKTFLANALYLYNLNDGYQTKRHYFNGQLFAIRDWNIPKPSALSWKSNLNTAFLDLEAGIRCDDIYLSRKILSDFGKKSIYFASSKIFYRPPETLIGMFRKYQRMRLEIERLNVFFPDTLRTHETWGRRKIDLKRLCSSGVSELAHYFIFQMGLSFCKIAYQSQRLYFTYLSAKKCPTWAPVAESKEPLS